eukprot:CAMPEP_0114224628 /NCGR_PEP_ID=MMETSP0058-20121206/215_1 /TAXON_ID=36894 /ORGANISM="Pyramimonas parkeae, CCMP726" /LENGTH=49 /DNA_ID=CAMNT_0001335129 /DNA_START=711 /DNA_END=860 /DNA_ORIENTATION=+
MGCDGTCPVLQTTSANPDAAGAEQQGAAGGAYLPATRTQAISHRPSSLL